MPPLGLTTCTGHLCCVRSWAEPRVRGLETLLNAPFSAGEGVVIPCVGRTSTAPPPTLGSPAGLPGPRVFIPHPLPRPVPAPRPHLLLPHPEATPSGVGAALSPRGSSWLGPRRIEPRLGHFLFPRFFPSSRFSYSSSFSAMRMVAES